MTLTTSLKALNPCSGRKGTTTSDDQIPIDLEEASPKTTKTDDSAPSAITTQEYRLYKRRFIVLAELVFLNLVIGWQGSAFTALTQELAQYLDVPISSVNLLSVVASVAFTIPSPIVIFVANKGGPKLSMVVCSAILLVGTWTFYAGAKTRSYGAVVAGNILSSMAQPFVLCIPTRNSKVWFPPRSRTTATALPSLAYPVGGGLSTFLGPVISAYIGIPGLAAVISSICTAACVVAPFVPASPPSPPSAVQDAPALPFWRGLVMLMRTPPFYLQFATFSVAAGAFLTESALIVNILYPYGFGITAISIAGALMIFVGLAATLLVSYCLDRFGIHLLAMKTMLPLLAATYTSIIFIGESHSHAAVYTIFSLVGVFAISLEPCMLEFQAAWTHPVPPEISSTFCWTGGQICGAVFTVIISYGINRKQTQTQDITMPITDGLVFVAVLVWLVVPLTLMTGIGPFKRSLQSQVYEF